MHVREVGLWCPVLLQLIIILFDYSHSNGSLPLERHLKPLSTYIFSITENQRQTAYPKNPFIFIELLHFQIYSQMSLSFVFYALCLEQYHLRLLILAQTNILHVLFYLNLFLLWCSSFHRSEFLTYIISFLSK